MRLTDAKGNLLSENLYWRSASDQEDFTRFKDLQMISLDGAVRIYTSGSDYILEASLKNTADHVAFAVRLKVTNPNARPGTDNRVLLTLYDDNYFTLMPGEAKQVIMRCSQEDTGNVKPQVWMEGYNVIKSQLVLR